ncbi:hypothetical protein B0O99DRAFT_702838 [Bisporella sp. PMI_857]|nr:hypothetical protein B0O99DRAFT_702838 [Bisporella sp. PMI_857]
MATTWYATPRQQRETSARFCDQDALRTIFALSMSAMYKGEVPLYGDLVSIVEKVNQEVISNASTADWGLRMRSDESVARERLDLERHGAIRLGTPFEIRTVRRLFALLGLHPVGYYDLSKAGLPMHATAFRPITTKALEKNPFRVFTTLLRLELLSTEARKLTATLLEKRNIFSSALLKLIDIGEEQGGFLPEQGNQFVTEALKTFQWQSIAASTYDEYHLLKATHPIVADIACFNSAHINHLTPRTLDIEASQDLMKQAGLAVKTRIEGPPHRRWPILLRQTSFLALQGEIKFPLFNASNGTAPLITGYHTARFGEIEQRGAAVTPAGRALFNQILENAMSEAKAKGADSATTDNIFSTAFEKFPDDIESLVKLGLIFCTFRCMPKAKGYVPPAKSAALENLLVEGILDSSPVTYEDFLPFSAAGIFQSNLHSKSVIGTAAEAEFESFDDKTGLELALGTPIQDFNLLYSETQVKSLEACAKELGLQEITW